MSSSASWEDLFPAPVPLSPPPNWRTPDHPPYSEMIQAAIRTLGEDGGSTLDEIDAYIKANYHDLPWGHRNLYPHYFKNLLVAGEVLHVGGGRFVIAPSVSPAPRSARRRHGKKARRRGSKGKEMVPVVAVHAEPGTMVVDDSTLSQPLSGVMTVACVAGAPLAVEKDDLHKPLEIQYSTQAQFEELRVADAAAIAAAVCDPQISGPNEHNAEVSGAPQVVSLLSEKCLAGNNDGLLSSKKRGRERSRKKKRGSEKSHLRASPEGKDGTLVQVSPCISAGGALTPLGGGRCRGRPPTRKSETEDGIDGTVAVVSAHPPKEQKKHGREIPRKIKRGSKTSQLIVTPKVKDRTLVQATPCIGAGGALSPLGSGRGRGRPPKRKREADDGIVGTVAVVSPQPLEEQKKHGRERPRKIKRGSKSSSLLASPEGKDGTLVQVSPCISAGGALTPLDGRRGRGRPPKSKREANDGFIGTAAVVRRQPPEEPKKHGRGRPLRITRRSKESPLPLTLKGKAADGIVGTVAVGSQPSEEKKKHGRERPRKIKRGSKESPLLVTPKGKDGTTVHVTPCIGTGGALIPPACGRGRGRPPKRKREAKDGIVGTVAVVSSQPPEEKKGADVVCFNIDAAPSSQASSPVSSSYSDRGKRQRRPSKKKICNDAKDTAFNIDVAVSPQENSQCSPPLSKGYGRGRGRFPKRKTDAENAIAQDGTEAKDVTFDSDAAISPQESNQCSPPLSNGRGRGRGRPPKKKIDDKDVNVNGVLEVKGVAFDINSSVSPQESGEFSQPLSKGHASARGRLPKKKIDADNVKDATEAKVVTIGTDAAVSPRESNQCSPLSKGDGRGRRRPPEKKTDMEIFNVKDGVEAKDVTFDINAAVSPQESNRCSPQLSKGRGRGRGRPPKKNTDAGDVNVKNVTFDTVPSDSPQESDQCTLPLSKSCETGRRRTPKRKTDADDVNVMFDVDAFAFPQESNQRSTLSEAHGIGRERPSLNKSNNLMTDAEDVNVAFDIDSAVSPQESNQCSSLSKEHEVGRGCPPKLTDA